MNGIRRRRIAVLGVLSMLATLLASVSMAQADVLKDLLVTVEPATTTASTTTDFTVTVTNLETNDKELGAVAITVPASFTVHSVTDVVADGGNSWSSPWQSGDGNQVLLAADSQMDRLLPTGQSVSALVSATPPNNQGADNVYSWSAVGRQATTFNDDGSAGGNEFAQVFADRDGTFDVRNADGTTTSQTLGTHQTLVTGVAVDCSAGPCTATLTEYLTTVTVSAVCGAGTLVVDTIEVDSQVGEIGAGAFYNYFGGCPEGTVVTVDIQYQKTDEVPNPGSLKFKTFYDKDILDLDPDYVGDGNQLPACKQNITVNCVQSVKSGSGVVNGQIKMLLTDPAGIGFK